MATFEAIVKESKDIPRIQFKITDGLFHVDVGNDGIDCKDALAKWSAVLSAMRGIISQISFVEKTGKSSLTFTYADNKLKCSIRDSKHIITVIVLDSAPIQKLVDDLRNITAPKPTLSWETCGEYIVARVTGGEIEKAEVIIPRKRIDDMIQGARGYGVFGIGHGIGQTRFTIEVNGNYIIVRKITEGAESSTTFKTADHIDTIKSFQGCDDDGLVFDKDARCAYIHVNGANTGKFIIEMPLTLIDELIEAVRTPTFPFKYSSSDGRECYEIAVICGVITIKKAPPKGKVLIDSFGTLFFKDKILRLKD